jgi:hypothetical protein
VEHVCVWETCFTDSFFVFSPFRPPVYKTREKTTRLGKKILKKNKETSHRGTISMIVSFFFQEHEVKKLGRETVVMPAKLTERLFSSVGLVKSDLWGRLLDSTLIDAVWTKQVP